MTPEQRAVAVAKTTTDIADDLTRWGVGDPEAKAAELVRRMQRDGWRVMPALAGPPPPRAGDPAHAQAVIADARAVVDAKRRARLEAEAAEAQR